MPENPTVIENLPVSSETEQNEFKIGGAVREQLEAKKQDPQFVEGVKQRIKH